MLEWHWRSARLSRRLDYTEVAALEWVHTVADMVAVAAAVVVAGSIGTAEAEA